MALGIGPGDAVITTPYTFFATAGCLSRVGARPVFVDIDPATFNLSPDALAHYLENVARRDADGTLRTPGPANGCARSSPCIFSGFARTWTRILRLGREYGLPVLEDASQAIGAEYPFLNGDTPSAPRPGRWASMGWFSFFPSKNLGAFGDGGMTPARDRRLRTTACARMRMHGMEAAVFPPLRRRQFPARRAPGRRARRSSCPTSTAGPPPAANARALPRRVRPRRACWKR